MAGPLTRRAPRTFPILMYLGEDANRTRHYFNKTVHGTKKQAQRFLTESLVERATKGD
jgi:hypothetical protein